MDIAETVNQLVAGIPLLGVAIPAIAASESRRRRRRRIETGTPVTEARTYYDPKASR